MNSWVLVQMRELLSLSVRINVCSSIQLYEMVLTIADVSAVMALDDYEEIGKFFGGFMLPQEKGLPGSKL